MEPSATDQPSAADQPDPTIDAYRRRIRVVAASDGRIDGELADDLHHFRVVLHHDGSVVTDITGEGLRHPWESCPAAAGELRALVGAPLEERMGAAAKHANPKANCTHMFDLAALSMAQAWRSANRDPEARSTERRQYDVELPMQPDEDHCVRPRLWRDGDLLLEWQLQTLPGAGRTIIAPEPYASVPFARGFFPWTATALDPDAGEAAFVLRRACDIGMGRGMDLDDIPVANDLADLMLGVCYTMQPGVIETAHRRVGATRDYAARPDAIFDDT
ncbi:MAG: hypothetical protein JWL73_2411 [Actinomycetia bacterium]|nr:hypothetical protein [Actinomycetes bacterium]